MLQLQPTLPLTLTLRTTPPSGGDVGRRRLSRSDWKFKRTLFKPWMLLCLTVFSVTAQVDAAGSLEYVLHRIPLIQESSLPGQGALVNKINDLGMVVGFHTPGGVRTGYVYDHLGLIGAPKTVHSLTEWIPLPAGWTRSSCVGINNNVQVVGYFERGTGLDLEQQGYFLDLSRTTPTWGLLPQPAWAAISFGLCVNDRGDVLVGSRDAYSAATTRQADIYNISTGVPQLVATRVGLSVDNHSDLNNAGQVTGDVDGVPVRCEVDGTFTEAPFVGSLDELGVVTGTRIEVTKERNYYVYAYRAARFSFGEPALLADVDSRHNDSNNAGDVSGSYLGIPALYTDESGWILMDDLVTGVETGAADEWAFWTDPATGIGLKSISNRNGSQGWIAAGATQTQTTTTGKGKNQTTTTTTEKRFYLLTPPAGG